MDHPATTLCPQEGTTQGKLPLRSYISRLRYHEIANELSGMGIERVDDVMATIRRILKFDPDNDAFVQYKKAFLEAKSARTGIPVYVLSGGKKDNERRRLQRQAARP